MPDENENIGESFLDDDVASDEEVKKALEDADEPIQPEDKDEEKDEGVAEPEEKPAPIPAPAPEIPVQPQPQYVQPQYQPPVPQPASAKIVEEAEANFIKAQKVLEKLNESLEDDEPMTPALFRNMQAADEQVRQAKQHADQAKQKYQQDVDYANFMNRADDFGRRSYPDYDVVMDNADLLCTRDRKEIFQTGAKDPAKLAKTTYNKIKSRMADGSKQLPPELVNTINETAGDMATAIFGAFEKKGYKVPSQKKKQAKTLPPQPKTEKLVGGEGLDEAAQDMVDSLFD